MDKPTKRKIKYVEPIILDEVDLNELVNYIFYIVEDWKIILTANIKTIVRQNTFHKISPLVSGIYDGNTN